MPKLSKGVTPQQVRAARAASRLTQAAASALVYTKIDNWQHWAQDRYPIQPAIFELFLLKSGQRALASPSEWLRSAS